MFRRRAFVFANARRRCDLCWLADVYSTSNKIQCCGVVAMKLALRVGVVSLFVPMFGTMLLAQQASPVRPWQEVTVPSVSEVAANFKAPPREDGAIQPFQSWNGADPAEVRARMSRDLDRLSANGVFIINLSPGRGA